MTAKKRAVQKKASVKKPAAKKEMNGHGGGRGKKK